MGKKLALALGVCACALLGQAASGAVITQSNYPAPPVFGVTSINGFDQSLGTLNSVDIKVDWTYDSTTEIPVSYPGGYWNPSVTFSSIRYDSNPPLRIIGNGYIDPFTGALNAPVHGSAGAEVNYTASAVLALFENPVVWDVAGFFPRITGSTSEFPDGDGSKVQVAYNYTPASAVPEPGTWAMMALGIGAIGYVSRKRNCSDLQWYTRT